MSRDLFIIVKILVLMIAQRVAFTENVGLDFFEVHVDWLVLMYLTISEYILVIY